MKTAHPSSHSRGGTRGLGCPGCPRGSEVRERRWARCRTGRLSRPAPSPMAVSSPCCPLLSHLGQHLCVGVAIEPRPGWRGRPLLQGWFPPSTPVSGDCRTSIGSSWAPSCVRPPCSVLVLSCGHSGCTLLAQSVQSLPGPIRVLAPPFA